MAVAPSLCHHQPIDVLSLLAIPFTEILGSAWNFPLVWQLASAILQKVARPINADWSSH